MRRMQASWRNAGTLRFSPDGQGAESARLSGGRIHVQQPGGRDSAASWVSSCDVDAAKQLYGRIQSQSGFKVSKQSRWFWLTLDFIQFQSKAKQRATKSKGISKVPKWGLRERRPRLHPLVGRSPHARTASDRSVARVARHAVRRATRSTRSTHSTRSTRSTRPQHTHSTRSTRSTRNEQHGSGSSGERRRGGGGGGSGSGSGGGEVSD